jgi:sulfoxide reductase heme-binding subunit YedZ
MFIGIAARVALGKILLSLIALGYIAYLVIGIFFDYLGANPIETLTHKTGSWALYFLLATLSITPLRRHFHWNALMRLRRFLGLWSFAFLFLHFFVFIFFDHFFDWQSIWADVLDRPYITVGFLGLLLMVPLAITSFKRLQRLMGKRWLLLHQMVYLIAILGIIHYWWLVKADILWPTIYGLCVLLLLADRVYWARKKNQQQ